MSRQICTWLCVLLAVSTAVQARLLGIDLGSRRVRAVLVRAGRPFDIVLDEATKRNAPVLVAFGEDERFFGNSAKRLAVRNPERSFVFMMRLLGRPFGCDEMKMFASDYLNYEFVRTDRGTIAVQFQQTSYPIEELIAMTLRRIKALAEVTLNEDISKAVANAKPLTITDAVLTVPVHFSPQQRQALVDAAQIAGLNVLSLINEDSAAAVQFGISRQYNASEVHTVGFFNMGASSTSVTITRFSSYVKVTGFRSNQTIGQFEVVGLASDATLGDQRIEAKLVEHFADQFIEQLKTKGIEDNIRNVPRVMARLQAMAKTTKEILSANVQYPVRVEALYKDIDFKSQLTRDELVAMGKDIFDRLPAVINAALANAKLKAADVDSFVLIGGASRIPHVQQTISTTLGRSELDQNLDADESMAFGSAFVAANCSASFRVRKFGAVSRMQFPIGVRLVNLEGTEPLSEEEKAWTKRASVFSKRSLAGKKRHIAFEHDRDVVVNMQIDDLDAEIPEICQYEVTGVREAYAELKEKGEPQLQLTFEGSADGRAELVAANVIVEETVMVPEVTKPSRKKAKKANGNKNSTEKKEGEADASEDKAADENVAEEKEPEEKPKMKEVKRKRSRALTLLKKPLGAVAFMSKEDIDRSIDVLDKLDESDEFVQDTARAKNNLESYIYETRARFNEPAVIEASEETVRAELETKLAASEDWIYDDHENESPTLFLERLQQHQSISDPIFERVDEAEKRSKALSSTTTMLAVIEGELERMREKMEWIPRESIDETAKMLEETRAWMNQVASEQEARKPHEELVFRVSELQQKTEPIVLSMAKLNRIPKPKPKPKPKTKTETKSSNESNATDADAATDTSTDTPADASAADAASDIPDQTTAAEPATEEQQQQPQEEETASGSDDSPDGHSEL